MKAEHIDRTQWARQMRTGMKASFLAAAFMAIAFLAHPRQLVAQDTIDEPIDESTVAATINAADADLENDQANADKAKGSADEASQSGSDATSGDLATQTPSDSPNAASSPASDQLSNATAQGAAQANSATEPASANAPNPSQTSSAVLAAGPAPGADVAAPSGPKSELALDTANLMKLANDLKSEVDKTSKDTLSITVVRQADKIEQLARKMRSK